MKNKSILSFVMGIIVTLLLSFNYSPSEKDCSLARVSKASGKWVFIRCEPACDYDVAFEVSPRGNENTPEGIANLIVTDALKVGKKKGLDFDAVVIGSGKKDIAIKFK